MPLSGCSALHGVKPNQKNIAYFCICVSLTSLLNYGLYVPYLPTYLCNLRVYVSTYFCIFLSTCFCTYLLTWLPAPVSLPFMYLRIYLLMSFTWLCTYKALFLSFVSASVLLFFTCLPAFFFYLLMCLCMCLCFLHVSCLRAYMFYVRVCVSFVMCLYSVTRLWETRNQEQKQKHAFNFNVV